MTLRLWKIHFFNQMMTQIFSTAIIKSKVNIIGCLESKMQTNYKWMINLFQNVNLWNCKLYLFVQHQFLFLKHFQSIRLIIFITNCKKNLSKWTFTQLFGEFKMFKHQTFLLFLFLIDFFYVGELRLLSYLFLWSLFSFRDRCCWSLGFRAF